MPEDPGPPSQKLGPWGYASLAVGGLVVGIGSFVAMVFAGPTLARLGLTGNAFYVVLLPLGLGTAAFLFGTMNSFATYSGSLLDGYLQLGGPIVGAGLVVLGGYMFSSPVVPFSVTVRVMAPSGMGTVVTTGKVTMQLGQASVEEQLNAKGEANFKELAPSFRFSKVHVYLAAPDVEAVDPDQLYDLSHQLVTIHTKSRRQSCADCDLTSTITAKIISGQTRSRPSLVRIPAGSFTMGSPLSEVGRVTDEIQHRVVITRDFLMSSTVITQAQYRNLTGVDPVSTRKSSIQHDCSDHGIGDNIPVVCITFREAIEFCNQLSKEENLPFAYVVIPNDISWDKQSLGYRLPTEAEWEYAARANTTTTYWSGNSPQTLVEIAWTKENSGRGGHRVASKAANPWGLFDMHGNVWQMVWDRFGAYPRQEETDPAGPNTGDNRVWRGGSWFSSASESRAAYRYRASPTNLYADLGFRVVRTEPRTAHQVDTERYTRTARTP